MTDSDRSISHELHQSLCGLRSSIDALCCAAELLPANSELEPVGDLFQILAERLQADLVPVFNAIRKLDGQLVNR